MEVTLKRERPTLTVNVGAEQLHVPLTLTRAELAEIGKSDDMEAATGRFFAKYLGDVYDELGDDDLQVLMAAWSEARAAIGAPGMGESSASPK